MSHEHAFKIQPAISRPTSKQSGFRQGLFSVEFAPEESEPDPTTMRRIQRGDSAAWDLFLGTYSDVLFRVARKYSKDYDEQMDLFVFVASRLREDRMRRIRAYRLRAATPCAFKTYLVVIARNLILDRIRMRNGRVRPFRSIERLCTIDRIIFDTHVRDRQPLEETGREIQRQVGAELSAFEIRERAGQIERSLSPSQRWSLFSRRAMRGAPIAFDGLGEAHTESSHSSQLEDAAPNPEASHHSERALREFARLFAQMDLRDRLALTLRYKDGLKIREVARVMRATEKQVEHWIGDAVRRLRSELQRSGVGPGELSVEGVERTLER